MLNSHYTPLGPVALPAYQGRREYMHGFDAADPQMLPGYEDYLPAVTELLARAGVTTGTAWMTVDESVTPAGQSQRRPGPHVDGKFTISQTAGKTRDPAWSTPVNWNHSCNLIPTTRTPVIIAASVAGCRAWTGEFDTSPAEGGDLTHAAHLLSDAPSALLEADQPTQRTFLRIALPQLENQA